MIDEQKIIGMLQAKALGCLDPEDDKEMQDFINEGHQFPWDELGKFQNIASLLPMALNLELPNSELKDRVALKLIKLSEQLRTNKILEEDKFEAEEDYEENADVFTNIEEAIVEQPIEIESEETVIEDNLVSSLNPENNNFNLDEITLPDFKSGEVSDENSVKEITIDSPIETLIGETKIDVPQIEEMNVEEVLQAPEARESIYSESTNNFVAEEKQKIEESDEQDTQPDLTRRSVADKMFKAIEQDFDSLKFHFDESERKITRGLLIAYVLIAVLLALLIFSFFKFSADIKNLENEIKELKSKSTSTLYIE
ncbi:MAG: hypothetical protein IH620_04135, partial [Ignavibacterium sp.]|nr:hypothetical protein [Ignavibacterium sp.]